MTTSLTPADKLVAVARQLRAGHTHAQVATDLDLTEDQVRELARDIPGLNAPRPAPAPTPAATPQPMPRPAPAAPAPVSPVEQGLSVPIGRLLEDASGHSKAAVRKLAAKIETQLDQLRALIKTHEAEEAARRADAEQKAKAKREIAELEAKLAAAKAALRGKAASPAPTGESTHACPSCGKPYSYAKALAKHQETCAGPS